MILHRLLKALFDLGVVFVMTSNYRPTRCIRTACIATASCRRSRSSRRSSTSSTSTAASTTGTRTLERTPTYLAPLGAAADKALRDAFEALAEAGDEEPRLTIETRVVRALRRAGGVVWFDFATLCGGPRSQNDYLEIANRFHTVMLSDVPQMGAALSSEARRFTWLVDVCYDRRVKLIAVGRGARRGAVHGRHARQRVPAHRQPAPRDALGRVPALRAACSACRSLMPDNRAMRFFVRAVLMGAALVPAVAGAQSAPEPGSLRERYPAASIDSAERADAALAETGGAKAHVQLEYRNRARDCMATFAVNACLDSARALQRKRLADIDAVELEANRFKRRDKADRLDADRQKREADRAANAAADGDLRARNRKAFEDRQAEAARAATDRQRKDARVAGTPSKPHRSAVKVAPPADTDVNRAVREKNAAQHATKLVEARAHQAEIERRVAAKTAERKRHADERAAKEARAAAAAAAKGAAGS